MDKGIGDLISEAAYVNQKQGNKKMKPDYFKLVL